MSNSDQIEAMEKRQPYIRYINLKKQDLNRALYNLQTCIILNRLKMKCVESNYQVDDELLDNQTFILYDSEEDIIEAFERNHMVKLPKDFYTKIDNEMIEIDKKILNRSTVFIGIQRYEIIDNVDVGKKLFNSSYSSGDLCIFVENKQDIIFIGRFKDYLLNLQKNYSKLQNKAWKNGKYMEWFIRWVEN